MLLFQHFRDHLDHRGVIFHRSCARHSNPQLIRYCAGDNIEIVDDFHVVRKKAYGRDDHVAAIFAQVIANIGTEPWLRRRTAAALEYQIPSNPSNRGGHRIAHLLKFGNVGTGL